MKKVISGLLEFSIISLLLLLFLFTHKLDIEMVFSETSKCLWEMKISYAFFAFALYIISVIVVAIRWKAVLKALGYDIEVRSLVPVIFGSIFINNFTPASRMGGEPLRVLWLAKQFKIRKKEAFLSIIYERGIEAIPVLFLLVIAIYFNFPQIFRKYIFRLFPFFIFIGIAPIACYPLRSRFTRTLERYGFSRFPSEVFFPTLFFSSLMWVMDVLRFKVVTLAFDVYLPIHVIALLSIGYLFLGIIPLTLGGMGIVEGGLISLLLTFGIPVGKAIGIVALERVISYGISSLIGAVSLFYFGGMEAWKSIKSQ